MKLALSLALLTTAAAAGPITKYEGQAPDGGSCSVTVEVCEGGRSIYSVYRPTSWGSQSYDQIYGRVHTRNFSGRYYSNRIQVRSTTRDDGSIQNVVHERGREDGRATVVMSLEQEGEQLLSVTTRTDYNIRRVAQIPYPHTVLLDTLENERSRSTRETTCSGLQEVSAEGTDSECGFLMRY